MNSVAMITRMLSKWARRCQLGRLLPSLLVLFLAVDVLLRVVPIELLSFRAWEAATQFAPVDAPFEPNRRIHLPREHGDLANLGNLPELREYRAGTIFTTDSFGFRHDPGTRLGGDVGAILIGDSFGVGATVNDDETLAVRLEHFTGCRIYNGSGLLPLMRREPDRIVSLARQLGMRGGLVIEEALEGPIVIPPQYAPGGGAFEWFASMLPRGMFDTLVRVKGFWTVSPLQIGVSQAVRLLENDRILPNSHEKAVVQRTLRNGQKILFAREDIEYAKSMPEVSIDRWVQLAATLKGEGLELLVVLVPRKYTVYQALLRDEAPASVQLGGGLDRIERQLRAAGIRVLNLTKTFRARAASDLDRGVHLYWRDDTHWNQHGMAVGAAEISRVWWAELTWSCRRGL